MTSRLVEVTLLTIAIVACHPGIGPAQVEIASWLDEPQPASWNKPGLPIPAAPRIEKHVDPRLAALIAGTQASVPSPSPELAGTSWQLVKFQGSDETTLTPDNRANYTIEFGAGGRLAARVDCNRGRGTWKSSGSNQVEFGPRALTRAKCPAGSLHDQIVKQWQFIRSYVIKDGHLFLALMADGGIYEFEPITGAERIR
jgi:heat shock protein HslJ